MFSSQRFLALISSSLRLLCALVGAEPFIVVNAGLGSAIDAAALVAYVNTPVGLSMSSGDDDDNNNDDDDTNRDGGSIEVDNEGRRGGRHRTGSGGSGVRSSNYTAPLVDPRLLRAVAIEEPRRRARNGAIVPWGCKWWGVGNEAYGRWQLGYVSVTTTVARCEFAHSLVYLRSRPLIRCFVASFLCDTRAMNGLAHLIDRSIDRPRRCRFAGSCGSTAASRGP